MKLVIFAKHVPEEVVIEALGFIPHWLNDNNPEPCNVQLGKNYGHGGGWKPFSTTEHPKFKIDEEDMSIKYPGDPKHKPIAKFVMEKHKEEVYMYDYAWVMVWNTETKHHEICRMD